MTYQGPPPDIEDTLRSLTETPSGEGYALAYAADVTKSLMGSAWGHMKQGRRKQALDQIRYAYHILGLTLRLTGNHPKDT